MRKPARATICRRWSTSILWLLTGCASTPPDPFLGQRIELTFGVDQKDEAAAVQASFEEAGYYLDKRIDGQRFAALSFRDAKGRPKAIRVITARGIALALDSVEATALDAAVSYKLLEPSGPIAADNEYSEGLLVLETRGSGEPCVRPYAVIDNGLVLGQDLGLPDQASPVCAQQVTDRDGDGRAELVAEYRVDGLPLPVVPEVKALLFANEEGVYSMHGPQAALDTHYAAEAAQRNEKIKQLAEDHQAMEVYRLAVELALIAHLRGQDAAAQRKLLEEKFALLVKEEREPNWEKAIMARVDEGW